MEFSTSNRRRHQRRSTEILFKVEKITDPANQRIPITTQQLLIVDISASGARFETDHFIPEQALLNGRFFFPDESEAVVCEGIVIRTNQPFSRTGRLYSFAVEFTQLTDNDRKRIESFVNAGGFVI